MAVVTKYGTGYKDPASINAPSAPWAEGRLLAINSLIAIANGDSANSLFYVGRVPSNAIISPNARMDYSAITGVSSLHVTLAPGSGGNMVTAASVAAAGNASLLSAVSVANLNKQAWVIAGYTADPGGMLDITVLLNAAATAAGSINFHIPYTRK